MDTLYEAIAANAASLSLSPMQGSVAVRADDRRQYSPVEAQPMVRVL